MYKQVKQGSVRDYKIDHNKLYYQRPTTTHNAKRKWLMCIPRESRTQILQKEHDNRSHSGMYRAINKIKRLYYWPGIYDSVYKYVRKCQKCRANKLCNDNRSNTRNSKTSNENSSAGESGNQRPNAEISVNNHDTFVKKSKKHNLRSRVRKIDTNQNVWISNVVQRFTNLAKKISSKVSPPKKIDVIEEKRDNNTYLIVSFGGKTIGKWHANNISIG